MDKPRKYFRHLGSERRRELEGAPLASFVRRLVAFAVDIAVVIILLAVVSLPSVLREGAESGNYHFHIDPFHGWSLLSLPAYFGIWTWLGRGQSLGKKLLRIRVVSLAHEHLSLWHSIERSLGYAASVLEGGFGFFQYFIHPNCQTVHDRIAETIVVAEKKGLPGTLPTLLPLLRPTRRHQTSRLDDADTNRLALSSGRGMAPALKALAF